MTGTDIDRLHAINTRIGQMYDVLPYDTQANTGLDPEPIMIQARQILTSHPKAQLLWASPRELLNIFHADRCGTHIITFTHDLLKKLSSVGYDLESYSLDTVRMFYNDAAASAFTIATPIAVS